MWLNLENTIRWATASHYRNHCKDAGPPTSQAYATLAERRDSYILKLLWEIKTPRPCCMDKFSTRKDRVISPSLHVITSGLYKLNPLN